MRHGFITYKEADDEGNERFYVLQKNFPHYVGEIVKVPELNNWCTPVSQYNLWIVSRGTLRGNIVPSFNDVSNQIDLTLFDMSQWFHSQVIMRNKDNYKKFKIKENV